MVKKPGIEWEKQNRRGHVVFVYLKKQDYVPSLSIL